MVKRVEDSGKVYNFPDDATVEEMDAAINGSVAYQQGREAPGALQGFVSAMQGPTLGFSDELGGAGAAVGQWLSNRLLPTPRAAALPQQTPTSAYTETRDFLRGAADQQKTQNPWTTGITRGMASAPLMALTGGASVPAGIVKQTGQAALAGGVFGGLSGAGESNASDAFGVTKDALTGALWGAGTAGASVPVVRGVSGVSQAVAGKFSDSAAATYAKRKIAEAFGRDAPGAESAAIQEALKRYGELGAEAKVADAGGASTRALLDTVVTLPGKTKQAAQLMVDSRQAGRAGRMIGAAEAELNPSGLRLQETVADLAARRSEAAKPIYERLYKTGVFVNEELQGIIQAADKLGAGGAAKTIATADRLPYTLSGDVKWAPMRQLDYLKQGLDDIIKANTDIAGHVNKVGAHVQGLKSDLVKVLDSETKGLYKSARDAFAGPSALIDAANEGRKFLRLDDQMVGAALKGMGESEKEAFRLGAFEALRSKMGTESGQTQIMKMWKEPATRERLQALFGDESSFATFAKKVAGERELKRLESVVGGSQTASRHYAAGDIDTSAVEAALGSAVNAKTGNIPGLLHSMTTQWNKVQTPEPVRNAIGSTLLSGGAQGRANLAAMEKIMQEVSDARMRQTLGLGLLGAQSRAVPGLLFQ